MILSTLEMALVNGNIHTFGTADSGIAAQAADLKQKTQNYLDGTLATDADFAPTECKLIKRICENVLTRRPNTDAASVAERLSDRCAALEAGMEVPPPLSVAEQAIHLATGTQVADPDAPADPPVEAEVAIPAEEEAPEVEEEEEAPFDTSPGSSGRGFKFGE